jgi:hypothetical protein
MNSAKAFPRLTESLSLLVAEIREDREATNRQITDLTGAIREQGAKIGLLSESISAQWTQIDRQRDGLHRADSKVEAISRAQVWTKETREAMIQGFGLLAVLAGLLSGPLVTFVAYKTDQTKTTLIDRIAEVESRLENEVNQLQQNAAADAVDRAWRDRAMRVQAKLSAAGVDVDWGDL